LILDPSRLIQVDADAKRGKSDDGWEVLEDQVGAKEEDRQPPKAALSDSVLREEDDSGWDEARREA
jgi:hypothetical protein